MPVAMLLNDSPVQVVPVGAPSSFDLHITVSNTGSPASGALANDLVITGSVDVNGDSVADYSGVLLTGKIVAMGSQDSGGTNDNFDFRFSVTGGALAPNYFSGQDIGLLLTTENSTFTGSFNSDFSALTKGTLGPVPPLVGALPISISGFKYQDMTGNGLSSDDLAHPLAGVTIKLYKDANANNTLDAGDTLVTSALTSGTGAYAFTNLSVGTYFVKEVQPSGYVGTAPASGLYTVNATAGAYSDLDFANYKVNCGCNCGCGGGPTLTTATSSLSGSVFVDCNNDGKRQSGESGISGVKITLTGTDLLGHSVTLTTTTDRNGSYTFSKLIAGNYTLTETDPANYADGKDSVGTLGGTLGNDVISNITVPPCADGSCYNFGELKTTSVCGHTGHCGCNIEIRGCDDKGRQVCYTTTTDCHGDFHCDGLHGGCYSISECDDKGRKTGFSGNCNIDWSNSCGSYASKSCNFQQNNCGWTDDAWTKSCRR